MSTRLPKLNHDLIADLNGSYWYQNASTKREIERCIESLNKRDATWYDRLNVTDIILMCHASEDVYSYSHRIINMPQNIGIHGTTKTSNF